LASEEVQALDPGPESWSYEAGLWLKSIPEVTSDCALAEIASGRCKVWLYRHGDDLIGFGSLGRSKWPASTAAGVRQISVIPWMGIDCRFRSLPAGPKRDRYASRIIDDLIAEALDSAATHPHIGPCVHPGNHQAIGLYRRHEFVDHPLEYVDREANVIYKRMYLTL
jgi:ribosomal protein S18 acetylase RimI-like enzyme